MNLRELMDKFEIKNKGNLVTKEFFIEEKFESDLGELTIEEATSHALSCDTFLAHSSSDIDLISKIIEYFINKLNAKPYIDKDDMELPKTTSPKTASLLIGNIEACKKFIIVVTDNSINSKWVPWELGIANASKKYNDVAVLQIEGKEVDGECKDNEYLGINNQIRQRSGELIVYNPDTEKSISINEWLK